MHLFPPNLEGNLEKSHEHFMSLAILEAKKGLGYTSPNPAVGAVIVKNGNIISTGYHKKAGGWHAEREAILNAGGIDLADAILYVTLEPCCHTGRTLPCTDLIIERKVGTVVFGSYDTDDRVRNKSMKILENAGVKVIPSILKEQCDRLNSIYFFNKEFNRPYIILKAALTLDGKIATASNNSKWISNEKSRLLVHKLRSRVSGIVCGGNTYRVDSPKLTCRLAGFETKILKRIIFSNSIQPTGDDIIINNEISSNPDSFIKVCKENEIDSILVEGGGDIYTWFINNNLVDYIYLFYKPSFLGKDGVSVFNKTGTKNISELNDFNINKSEIIDDNISIELYRGNTKYLPEL